MSSIFRHFSKKSVLSPSNTSEYVSLQIARHLGDSEHAAEYMGLTSRLSLPAIIGAYHEVRQAANPREKFWTQVQASGKEA